MLGTSNFSISLYASTLLQINFVHNNDQLNLLPVNAFNMDEFHLVDLVRCYKKHDTVMDETALFCCQERKLESVQ